MQKLKVLLTSRRKLPREKTFPDEILYQTNTFLQTEVKVELQIKIENGISIVNATDDWSGCHIMIFVAIYPINAGW